MIWALLVFLLAALLSITARRAVIEAKSGMISLQADSRIPGNALGLVMRIIDYLDGFVAPYALLLTWFIVCLACSKTILPTFYLACLLTLTVYYNAIPLVMRWSVTLFEVLFCYLALRQSFVDMAFHYALVACAASVLLSKIWGIASSRMRCANALFISLGMLSLIVMDFSGTAALLSAAVIGALIGDLDISWHKIQVPRHSDLSGSFFFYASSLVLLQMHDDGIANVTAISLIPASMLLASGSCYIAARRL